MNADTLRRHAYRLLLLVAAVALTFAGMQAANAAPDALRHLSILNLGLLMGDVNGMFLPIALALVAGMSGLVIAPDFATGGVEFVPDERWQRIWARDM